MIVKQAKSTFLIIKNVKSNIKKSSIERRELDARYWLLASGLWLLATGFWTLDFELLTINHKHKLQTVNRKP